MKRLQVQGVRHTTLVGSSRASATAFREGLAGMPFACGQPVSSRSRENHRRFDPGDGRLRAAARATAATPRR